MFTVVFSWVALFIIFLSFGEVVVTFWNTVAKRQDSYSITDKLWIGICFIGTLLLWLSIFIPLNIWVLVVIFGITLVIVVTRRRVFVAHLLQAYESFKKYPLIYKLIYLSTSIVILCYALSPPLIYDQGLYHLQSMQWTEKYPAVLGLGNLHGRLGFNSSFLLLSTLFNYHPESYYTAFTLNSLLLVVFALWIIGKISETKSLSTNIALGVILLLSIFTLGANASSSSTDVLPSILILYILIKWALNFKDEFAVKSPLLIALLPIFCITLKLSSASIILALLICLTALFRQGDKRTISAIIGIGFIIALPWLTRFVILTGYLVYPFPTIDIFSFDWKIPIDMVIAEKDAAYAWARMPNMDTAKVLAMKPTEWIPLWIERASTYVLLIYSLAILSPLLILVSWRYIKNKTIVTVWLVTYLGVWFNILTAPDIRFAFGFLVASITIPLLLIFDEASKRIRINISHIKIFTLAFILISMGFLGVVAYNQVSFHNKESNSLIIRPLAIDTKIKKEEIRYQTHTFDKATIFTPIGTNQCANHPIPCAPYYNSNLEMIGNEIQDGFRIKH